MNWPNKLTIIRILLIFPFIICFSLFLSYKNFNISYNEINKSLVFWIISAIFFILAMITDFVDGYLARKYNQITTFGKLFDPIADKFMTTSALIFLSISKIVPFWITIIFILRDILVDGSRNLAASNKIKIAASIWGKAKTFLQSISIILIFFIYPIFDLGIYEINEWNWNIIWINLPLIGSMILSIISGYKYFQNIIPILKNKI